MAKSTAFLTSLAVLTSVLLAGCVAGDAETLDAEATDDASMTRGRPADAKELPGHISGTIIDAELLPIADVEIIVTPGDHVVVTDAAGTFVVGPLEPGSYTVIAQKRGYATKEAQVTVTETDEATVRLTLEAIASDVPHHETFSEAMYLICHVVVTSNTLNTQITNLPCGAVDIFAGSTNTLDHWIFFFTIDKPGFKSLVMEMTWDPQQFGHDGLMQLSTEGRVESNSQGGVTVAGSVYGETMGPPFHDVIHAGMNYWGDGSDNATTFYPEPNATENFKMLIAGGGDNTTFDGTAFFLEFRPTAYLTFFYNRQASDEFTILPPE